MANATSRAQSTTTPWETCHIKRDLSVGTATTYYTGTMIAINAAGAAVKCDDTAGLRFDGLMADSQSIEVATTDTLGDKKVTVEKPFLFTMTIASAAITDVGRKVYAKYDNEVAYSGVSNSILVGTVEAYVNATTVLIRPYWTSTSGVNAFDGEVLTFTGATTANEVAMPDNLASALAFREGATDYLTFVTTNSGELIYASKKLRAIDNVSVTFGDADDVAITWDATRLNVTQAATNSEIRWGVDGAGIDQRWYGDTASTNMLWDQSADTLLFTGACRVQFTGTTGQPEMWLTDNLADALSVKIASGNDMLVFTTTNSAESVAVRGLRTVQDTAVAITGATTLTLGDSGGIFTVSQASAYDIDLPSPTSGPGCRYFFSLTGAAANAVTITVAGSAATFVGSITIDGATIVATGSTLTFASGSASLGDSIEIQSIATNLYHVRAFASAAGGITIA